MERLSGGHFIRFGWPRPSCAPMSQLSFSSSRIARRCGVSSELARDRLRGWGGGRTWTCLWARPVIATSVGAWSLPRSSPRFCSRPRRGSFGRLRNCGVRVAVITSTPADQLPNGLADLLSGHWRVDDALDPLQIVAAVEGLSGQVGRVDRLVGALEHLQEPLAVARQMLGIDGMDVQTARNVRDKAQMKSVCVRPGFRARVISSSTLPSRRLRSPMRWASHSLPSRRRGRVRRRPSGSTSRPALQRVVASDPPARGLASLLEVPDRRRAHLRQRHHQRSDGVGLHRRLHPAAA